MGITERQCHLGGRRVAAADADGDRQARHVRREMELGMVLLQVSARASVASARRASAVPGMVTCYRPIPHPLVDVSVWLQGSGAGAEWTGAAHAACECAAQ